MSVDAAPAPPRWLAWLPLVTATGFIVGVLIACGGYVSSVQEHERRITNVEHQIELLRTIDVRMARIETKIEMIVPGDRR